MLLWKPLAETLGAIRCDISDDGRRAEIYVPPLKYGYEVVTRSYSYLLKHFKARLEGDTYIGRYTVVEIDITPPLPGLADGGAIHLEDPPTTVRSLATCTAISTVCRSYTIMYVKEACMTPFRLERIINLYAGWLRAAQRTGGPPPRGPQAHLQNFVDQSRRGVGSPGIRPLPGPT